MLNKKVCNQQAERRLRAAYRLILSWPAKTQAQPAFATSKPATTATNSMSETALANQNTPTLTI